jgi:hypothetical protein
VLIKSHEVGQAPQAPGCYETLGSEIGALVDEKQRAYGDSFGRAHRVLHELLADYYDEGREVYELPRTMLPHLLTITRILDKLFRVVTNPNGDRMGESPYRDIAGYALLAVAREEGR